jgi:hypothetical protein
MRVFNRKSQLERVLETVRDPLDPSNLKKIRLPDARKALRNAAIAVGGFTGLTAASAGISSIRRRSGRAAHDS